MPSNRLIPILRGGALLQIHALEDGVLAVALLDSQHGLLDLPLPSVGGLVRLLLLFLGGVVSKQVQLLRLPAFGGAGLVQQPVGADAQPPHQQVTVHDPVVW